MKRHTTNHRSGFTVVELLMVIVIIAILMALLLPALQSVRQQAQVAQVSTEIKALETALTLFKTEFGALPPSRIILHEHTDGWFSDQRSMNIVRMLWPQFDFGVPSTRPTPRLLTWDINGDGDTSDTLVLTGAECLAFFTAGMMDNGVPVGFSKNPRNPFEIDRGTRIGPFHEFDIARFIDVDNDGMVEYMDPLSKTRDAPYLYLSSYEGKGYQPDHDADVFEPHAAFTASIPDTRPDLGIDSNGDGVVDEGRVYYQNFAPTRSGMVAHQRDGYQIICPGFDGEYGEGGSYNGSDGLFYVGPGGGKSSIFSGPDADNITNFSRGQLGKN
jgi:prepilin-type N-terminal cleavage/methylation domain-containing protein